MNFKLRSLVAATLAGSMLMGFGTSAMADSTDDILNALIAKGILTEEEGALLQKGRTGEKEAAEKKKKEGVSAKFKNGAISLESGDGNNSIALTGRMHFDARSVDANTGQATENDRDTKSLADNFEIRRARIGAKGKFMKNFDYEVVGNLVGSNTNILDVAFVNWSGYQPFQIRVGQFKQPFNLEELTSSNNIDFMERSYINQITPAKKPGAMIHGVPTPGLTYAVSAYQQSNWGEESMEENGKSFAARATLNFAELADMKESVLHLGAAGFDTEYGINPTASGNTSDAASATTRATVFAFRSGGRGLSNAYRAQIGGASLPTATYGGMSNYTARIQNKAYGLELAAAHKSFKFQSEFTNQSFDASHVSAASGTGSNAVAATNNTLAADVQAYYVEALYMLTGENYADWYKNGAWSAIKPNSDFNLETGKGKGAWEIGLRFDEFKVDNTNLTGSNGRFQGTTSTAAAGSNGGAKTYTAGLKWVLNPNMRMMLNYSHTKYDTAFAPIDMVGGVVNDKEDLVMMRTQFSF